MIINKDNLNDIKFSLMTLDDLDNIKNILTTEFDDFWNYNVFKSEIINPNSSYIVAKFKNEIIGFAGFYQCLDEIDITNVVIKKIYRNLGLGKLLFKNLLDLAISKHPTSITLEVAENNNPAIKIYSNFGFKNVGLRKKYYNGITNAIIMTKTLENN